MGWLYITICCDSHGGVSPLADDLWCEIADHKGTRIGVTTVDRPAAAPQEGDFDLGYRVIGDPSFIAGMTASATIFVSSSGTSSFMPVIAEMRNPKDYKKALFTCMAILNASYLAFSLVVYRWCGVWMANPSLGVSLQIIRFRVNERTYR